MHTGLEDRLWDFGKLAAYYERARGGVGLIVTGGFAPCREGWLLPFGSSLTSALEVPAHRRLTQAVHAEGGKILLQILHAGRYGYHPMAVSASPLKSPISWFTRASSPSAASANHPRLRPLRAAGQGRRLRRRGGDGQRRLPAQPVPLPAHQSPRRPVGRPAGKPHAPGAGDRPRHPADRRPTLHPLLSPVAARPGRGRQYLGRGAAHRPGPGGSRNHPAQHRHRLARVARADHRHLGAARASPSQRTAAPRAEGAGDRQ